MDFKLCIKGNVNLINDDREVEVSFKKKKIDGQIGAIIAGGFMTLSEIASQYDIPKKEFLDMAKEFYEYQMIKIANGGE